MIKRSSSTGKVRPNVPKGMLGPDIPIWASQRPDRPRRNKPLLPEAAPGTVGASGSWFTVKQVAEMLKLSEKTIRRLVAKGDLPAVRIGRSIRLHIP